RLRQQFLRGGAALGPAAPRDGREAVAVGRAPRPGAADPAGRPRPGRPPPGRPPDGSPRASLRTAGRLLPGLAGGRELLAVSVPLPRRPVPVAGAGACGGRAELAAAAGMGLGRPRGLRRPGRGPAAGLRPRPPGPVGRLLARDDARTEGPAGPV